MRARGCAFIRLYNKKCKVLISLPSLNSTVSLLLVWFFCVFCCSTWQRFYWNINSLLSKTEFYPPPACFAWRSVEEKQSDSISNSNMKSTGAYYFSPYPTLLPAISERRFSVFIHLFFFLHNFLINLYCWWIILQVTEPELFVDSSSPSCWANRHVPSVASGYENIFTFRSLWNPFDFFIDMFHIHTFINMKSSHSFDVGKWNFKRFTQKIPKIEFIMY